MIYGDQHFCYTCSYIFDISFISLKIYIKIVRSTQERPSLGSWKNYEFKWTANYVWEILIHIRRAIMTESEESGYVWGKIRKCFIGQEVSNQER